MPPVDVPRGSTARPPRAGEVLSYYLTVPLVWCRQFFHNAHGILRVLDITRWRPLPAGMIGLDHPWATGVNPATGKPIWFDNVLYRSPRSADDDDLPADDFAIEKTCQFLAQQTAQSAVTPEIPWGPRRHMPHAINYIHGASHYNSGILVFTDFADAIFHFSDPRFAAQTRRFAREQRREVLVIFRQRQYEPRDYAYFSGFLRSIFPWFCNANGPQKRVLWGNPAPFPASNIITGNWIRDIYTLKQPGGAAKVVRPPIPARRYFTDGPYRGWRQEPLWPEKLLVRYTYWRIRMRGPRGGLFFVDRRKLLAEPLRRLRQEGVLDEPIARI
jgi:hypothetical protein